MRAGYATRGVTYLIVGILALLAAWTGGQAEGTKGALAQLREQPWGTAALWIIAVGLAAYALWRFIDAGYDLDDHGSDGKGLAARAALVASGIIHAFLAFSVVRLAMGRSESEGGQSGTESMVSKLMALPLGAILVMIAGGIVVAAGLYYAWKGWSRKYEENLACTAVTERLSPALQAGQIARGLVVVMIGVFLFYAGYATEPGQAGGMEEALRTIREQAYGRVLLALVAAGLLGFSLYCFVEAIYRVVPRCADPDLPTLAGRTVSRLRAQVS